MNKPPEVEEALVGGNASESVVRVGDTVRKPWLETTERTITFMKDLLERGIDLPAPRGRDEKGRLVLDFVPGDQAMERGPLDATTVRRVGGLIRQIHDASNDLAVPDSWNVLLPAHEPDLLCHNDLATWNLIIDGDRLVFIDWDGAGPSTRRWDLAYAAIAFGNLFPEVPVKEAVGRLVPFLEGYDADDTTRAALPVEMARRAGAKHDPLRRSSESGREPWSSMFLSGHGQRWRETAAYLATHERKWVRALS